MDSLRPGCRVKRADFGIGELTVGMPSEQSMKHSPLRCKSSLGRVG